MIGDVTLCIVSCNIPRNLSGGWELLLNDELLLAAQQKYFETSCKRDMLYCPMAGKCVEALWQSLRKVEPDFNSCNAYCNKNVARLYDCEACYTLQLRLQLGSLQSYETSCIV